MTWPWNLPVALLLLPRRTGRFLVIISLAGLLSGSVTADIEELKNRTDEYYNNLQYDLIVEVLEPFKDGDSAELLWRLARARYEQRKSLGSEAEKRELLEETMKTVERAMSLDSTDPNCHKWMAIYLNAFTKLQGTKARLMRSYDIKHHILKACEYGPNDPTNWYLLGMWSFTVADMPWYQRKTMAALFIQPPEASYEEALDYFLKAEQIQPGFYSMNLMMIGKTYLRAKDKAHAREYLEKARDFPVRTSDDEQAHKEAIDLLKSL